MFLHFTKSTRLLRFFLALFKEMTVAGICRITCDVNVLLEVRGVEMMILMGTLMILVKLITIS